jgi:hypothetical protein
MLEDREERINCTRALFSTPATYRPSAAVVSDNAARLCKKVLRHPPDSMQAALLGSKDRAMGVEESVVDYVKFFAQSGA